MIMEGDFLWRSGVYPAGATFSNNTNVPHATPEASQHLNCYIFGKLNHVRDPQDATTVQ
jgi:hypothetical protein